MGLMRRREFRLRIQSLLVDQTVSSSANFDDTFGAVRRELTGLRESLELSTSENAILRAVTDASPLGVLALDLNGEELVRNPSIGEPSSPEGALIRQTIESLIPVVGFGPACDVVDLAGPPRRSLEVTVRSLHRAPSAIRPTRDLPREGRGSDSSSSVSPEVLVGSALGTVSFVADVTEKRRIDAVRRDFISNISHELRTPVGAIAILAETLTDETDLETSKRLTRRLEQESHRLATMVDDLLSLTRFEAEDGVECLPVAVSDLFDRIVERSGSSAELRGITVDIAGGGDLYVSGDRRQLVSALTNLVDNAMKYSGENSTVTLNAQRVSVEGERSLIELQVIDHGIGIPPRERERIFERFYRVDKARARDTGGTGLGLAIVRHVAVNHGGSVRVDSLEGIGSTFVLTIPEA